MRDRHVNRLASGWLSAAAAVAVFAVTSAARADERHRAADAQLFKPAMDSAGIFTVESGGVLKPLRWGFKAAFNVGNEPMSLNLQGSPSGGTVAVVDYSLGINLQACFGLVKFLQFGVDLSLMRQWLGEAYSMDNTDGFVANDPLSNTRRKTREVVAGDARLALKFGFLNHKGFQLAAMVLGVIPLGDETVFAGERTFAGHGLLAFSYVHPRFMVAVNAGYLLRRQQEILEPVAAADGNKVVLLELDDEVTWGAGMKVGVVRRLAVGVEVYGRVPVMAKGPSDLPMEALAGLMVKASDNVSLAVGGGVGFGRYLERDGIKPLGRGGTWRFFLSASFAPMPPRVKVIRKDTDGDQILDHVDKCINEIEDLDGFEDNDGCPEPDNDQDGIQDLDDKCPNQSEDMDGFMDADGCPDTDNDGDGIADLKDQCINEPEDHDGYNDTDGCPDVDNDGDGIADASDRCPDEPGPAHNNGCPVAVVGTGPTVVAGRIKVKEKLYFSRGKAAILARSKKILNRVADLLKRNRQIRSIRIEGHTDSRGNPRRNLRLSQARADAVRDYLVMKGVVGDRLQSAGYGDRFPIKSNKTAQGRAANRRVEFIVVYE